MTKELKYFECKHARYFLPSDWDTKGDVVLVKGVEHYTDGTSKPVIRPILDYKREFFITKEAFRNHEEKKEWEHESRLRRFTSTQRDLPNAIRRAFGQIPGQNERYSMVARSQYLYGADTSTSTIIKHKIDKKMRDGGHNSTPYSVMALDLETDVNRGTGEIITGAVVNLNVAYCYYTEAYEAYGKPVGDLVKRTQDKIKELFPERIDISDIEFIVKKVERPVDVCIELLNRVHEHNPDILAIWNMVFDIKKFIECFEDAGLDIAEYFSHPSIPPAYKQFKFVEAPLSRVTASGKKQTKHVAELWHKVLSPNGFVTIDAMCFYKLARVAKGMQSSYSLDYITSEEGVGGKLKFDIGEMPMLEWHKQMQTNHKAEYLAYNIYDCLVMCQLDEVTKDLQIVLPMLCGHSDFDKFTSTPRRLSDDVEFKCRERGLVMGTTSDNMEIEIDKLVVGMDMWIITLPAHHMHPAAGLNVFGVKESWIPSGIITHGADSDARAAYPNTGIAFNISKENTKTEVYAIEGINSRDFRKIGINLTSARLNSGEICEMTMGAPSLLELGAAFEEYLAA